MTCPPTHFSARILPKFKTGPFLATKRLTIKRKLETNSSAIADEITPMLSEGSLLCSAVVLLLCGAQIHKNTHSALRKEQPHPALSALRRDATPLSRCTSAFRGHLSPSDCRAREKELTAIENRYGRGCSNVEMLSRYLLYFIHTSDCAHIYNSHYREK